MLVRMIHRVIVALAVIAALVDGAPARAGARAWTFATPAPKVDASLKVHTQLVSELTTIRPGEPFWVALHQRIAPGWHTYWRNPGDSGEPVTLAWSAPPGFVTDDIAWPAFTVFGTPGVSAAWGWRVEGHHLSLNFTLVPGRPVAVTPAFIGANPAAVRSGPRAGLRPLEQEQDLGLALARGVDPALRSRLVLGGDSLGDIVSGPGRRDLFTAPPAGVALAAMSGEQRALAVRLVETYARNVRAEIADHELERMRDAGVEKLHFAWAGPIDPARPHYYRIHGPTLLIEYDNSQNSANHIHSVLHDPVNDFGADLLRAHYERGHHHV